MKPDPSHKPVTNFRSCLWTNFYERYFYVTETRCRVWENYVTKNFNFFFPVLNIGQCFYLRQSLPIVSFTYITLKWNKKVLVGCDAYLRPKRKCSQLLLQIRWDSLNINCSTLYCEAWTQAQGNLEVLHRALLRLPSRNTFCVKYFCKLPDKVLQEW